MESVDEVPRKSLSRQQLYTGAAYSTIARVALPDGMLVFAVCWRASVFNEFGPTLAMTVRVVHVSD